VTYHFIIFLLVGYGSWVYGGQRYLIAI